MMKPATVSKISVISTTPSVFLPSTTGTRSIPYWIAAVSTDETTIPRQNPRIATGSTEGELPREDRERSIVFPCEQCGSELRFHIGDQVLHCAHCGFNKELLVAPDSAVEEQDFKALVARLAEQRKQSPWADDKPKEIDCDSCGATIRFDDSLTSKLCAFCGVPLQLDGVHLG